jgi:hypothetical protein
MPSIKLNLNVINIVAISIFGGTLNENQVVCFSARSNTPKPIS